MIRMFLLTLLFVNSLALFAQAYDPTTLWPYVKREFSKGVVFFADNSKAEGVFNVHLYKCDLHKLEGEKIIAVDHRSDIVRVEIGDDAFIFVDKQLCRIVAANSNAIVVKHVKGDFDKLTSGTGAYGSTLNTSGKIDLSSIDIGGMNTTDHNDMRTRRDNSRILPLKVKYYLVSQGQTVECTKKGVAKMLPDDRQDAWKAFVKSNKVKFGKDDGIAKVVDFFAE